MRRWVVLKIVCSAFLLLSWGCDIVEEPYSLPLVPSDTGQTARIQRILIEDYTGFQCGNCPEASEIANGLKMQYPERIVVLSVHAGFFAEPTKEHPEDYRTTIGEEWNSFFGIDRLGYPNGMVNRQEFQGKRVIRPSEWPQAVLQLLDHTPPLDLRLRANYDSLTRRVTVFVEAEYYEDQDPDNYLGVYIVEDSVIGYQLDYRRTPPDVEDYVHRHMLRSGITGAWGIPVSQQPISAGTVYRDTLSAILDPEWKAHHCSIVAFVHKYPSGYQVLQVTEVPVTQ